DWLRVGGRLDTQRMRKSARARLALQRLDERSLPSATFVQTNLVSDAPGVARLQNPNLSGAIGIALDTVDPVSQSFGFAIPSMLSLQAEVFALGSNSLARSSSIDLGDGLPTGVVFNSTGSN